MEISGLQAIIRASSAFSLEKICGQETIVYCIHVCQSLGIKTTVIVDSDAEHVCAVMQQYHADAVHCVRGDTHTIVDAYLTAVSARSADTILIFDGNMPNITAALITEAYTQHVQAQSVVSVVVSDTNVQNASCPTPGILMFVQKYFMEKRLAHTQQNGVELKLYADVVHSAVEEGVHVLPILVSAELLARITTVQELYEMERTQCAALIANWMAQGVRFACMLTVHIDRAVTIGTGSFIGAGVHLLGTTHIGKRCHIHAGSFLEAATIGDNSTIYPYSVIKRTSIGMHAQIGPFAHVHGDNSIGDQAIIGNFVEIKRSLVGAKTKVKHLSYLGDARVGDEVNIGAGSITCNHDGFTKHTTTIENNAYIGTNTTLIAPVTIAHDAFVAAGSTITKDVPSYALALARTRQINKEGYVHKLREKKQKALQGQEASSVEAFIGAVKTEPKITSSDRV